MPRTSTQRGSPEATDAHYITFAEQETVARQLATSLSALVGGCLVTSRPLSELVHPHQGAVSVPHLLVENAAHPASTRISLLEPAPGVNIGPHPVVLDGEWRDQTTRREKLHALDGVPLILHRYAPVEARVDHKHATLFSLFVVYSFHWQYHSERELDSQLH